METVEIIACYRHFSNNNKSFLSSAFTMTNNFNEINETHITANAFLLIVTIMFILVLLQTLQKDNSRYC